MSTESKKIVNTKALNIEKPAPKPRTKKFVPADDPVLSKPSDQIAQIQAVGKSIVDAVLNSVPKKPKRVCNLTADQRKAVGERLKAARESKKAQ